MALSVHAHAKTYTLDHKVFFSFQPSLCTFNDLEVHGQGIKTAPSSFCWTVDTVLVLNLASYPSYAS
jgi:hypothetical protein